MDTESHPAPGKGLLGSWDKIVGPGATRGETTLTLAAMAASIPLAASAAIAFGPPVWPPWTWIVLLVLASDLGGGLVANALPATKRWYHRPGASHWSALGFAALHVHTFVMAWIAPAQMSWVAAGITYAWMMASCVLVILTPAALRLAVAFALTATGVVTVAAWMPIATPLGWVPAVLLLKIVAGHMVGPDERAAPPPVSRTR